MIFIRRWRNDFQGKNFIGIEKQPEPLSPCEVSLMIQGKGGNGITKRTWSSIFLLGFLAQGILRLDPEGLSWKRRYHARERILHNQIEVIIKTIRNGPAKQAYLLAEPEAQRAALPAAVWPSLKIQGAAGYVF
jgi:hypothetical protein